MPERFKIGPERTVPRTGVCLPRLFTVSISHGTHACTTAGIRTERVRISISRTLPQQQPTWYLETPVANDCSQPLELRRNGIVQTGVEGRTQCRIFWVCSQYVVE